MIRPDTDAQSTTRAERIATIDVAKGLLVCLASLALGDGILEAAGFARPPIARAATMIATPAFYLIAGLLSGRLAPTLEARVVPRRVYPYIDRFAMAAFAAVGAAYLARPLAFPASGVMLVGAAFIAIVLFERIALQIERGGRATTLRTILCIQVLAALPGAPTGIITGCALFLLGRVVSRSWGALTARSEAIGTQAGFLAVAVVLIGLLATVARIPGETYVLADAPLAHIALAYAGAAAALCLALTPALPGGRLIAILGRGAPALAILWPLLVVGAARFAIPWMSARPAALAPMALALGVALTLAVVVPVGLFRSRQDGEGGGSKRRAPLFGRLQIGADAG